MATQANNPPFNKRSLGSRARASLYDQDTLDMANSVPIGSIVWNVDTDQPLIYVSEEKGFVPLALIQNFHFALILQTPLNLTTVTVGDTLSYTADIGLDWAAGERIVFLHNSGNRLTGTVTSYDQDTGAISFIVDSKEGTGSFTQWTGDFLGANAIDGRITVPLVGVFANFTALNSSTGTRTVGDIAFVNAAQGLGAVFGVQTPGWLGGTYYPSGYYMYGNTVDPDNGSRWVFTNQSVVDSISTTIGRLVPDGGAAGQVLVRTALGYEWQTVAITGTAAGFGTPTATTIAPVDATTLGTATVTATGPDTAKAFALGIPAGLKGDKGDAGDDGNTITVTKARNTDDDANVVTFTSSDTTVTPTIVTIPDGVDGTDATGSGIASGTTLPTTTATANEVFYLTATEGTNTAGLYVRASGTTTWTASGIGTGDQFANQQALEDFIASKPDFRADIGAGTSDLALGTTATTALAGNSTTDNVAETNSNQYYTQARASLKADRDEVIPPYSATTNYGNNSLVYGDDGIHRSLVDNNRGQLLTNTTNWRRITFDAGQFSLLLATPQEFSSASSYIINRSMIFRDGQLLIPNRNIVAGNAYVASEWSTVSSQRLTTLLELQGVRPTQQLVNVVFDASSSLNFTYTTPSTDFKFDARDYDVITVGTTSLGTNPIRVTNKVGDVYTIASAIPGVSAGDTVTITVQKRTAATFLEVVASIIEFDGDLDVLGTRIHIPNIPTSDPGIPDTLWLDNGVLVLSGFTAYDDADARDAVDISHSGNTLTYTDASDAIQTYTPTVGSETDSYTPSSGTKTITGGLSVTGTTTLATSLTGRLRSDAGVVSVDTSPDTGGTDAESIRSIPVSTTAPTLPRQVLKTVLVTNQGNPSLELRYLQDDGGTVRLTTNASGHTVPSGGIAYLSSTEGYHNLTENPIENVTLANYDFTNRAIWAPIGGEEVSISNGTAVAGQYVSGANEADGAINLTRLPLPVAGDFNVNDLDLDNIPGTGPFLTVSGNVLGRASATTSPTTGVTPNPTSGFIPLGQGMNSNFINSTIQQVDDELQSFRASINHDQGGRDFNLNPGGIPVDFETNFANYDVTLVSSSDTTLASSISEIITSPSTAINASGSNVVISGLTTSEVFSNGQIVTIRYGDILIYSLAAGVNYLGNTSRVTTTSALAIVFPDSTTALTARDNLRASIGSRLTVVSNLTTATVTAYNPTTHEGRFGHLIDGRLAHGDLLMFAQRAGTVNLLTHLTIGPDVINIPATTALILDGDTTIHGNTTVTGTLTVPKPVNRGDAAQFDDTWLPAIESSGFPEGSRRLNVGGQTNVEVVEVTAVEGAGGIQTWYAYIGVVPNSAKDGFSIAFEGLTWSNHSTDPFAAGTSTTDAPINILGTADNDFIRDITVRGDARVGGDLTVVGDTSTFDLTTTGNITATASIDITDEFTDFPAATVGRNISGTVYQGFYTSDAADPSFHEFDFLVNATTQAAIEALTPWDVGDRITVYFPSIDEAAEMAVVATDGTSATNGFLANMRTVECTLDATNGAIARRAATVTDSLLSFTAHYISGFRIFNTPTLPRTGDVSVGKDLLVSGDVTTGSGNNSLTTTAPEELYVKVRSLATSVVLETDDIPSAFGSAGLVVSRTLTQGSTSTLYYSVFNTELTTETLYISTDLTNAIHTKTLR